MDIVWTQPLSTANRVAHFLNEMGRITKNVQSGAAFSLPATPLISVLLFVEMSAVRLMQD